MNQLELLRRETDMSVWWRARVAGWSPRAEHCPPDRVVLAGDWREDAERFLRGRRS